MRDTLLTALLAAVCTLGLTGHAHAVTLDGLTDYHLGTEFYPDDSWNQMETLDDDGLLVVEADASYNIDGTDYPVDLIVGTRDDLITFTGVAFHNPTPELQKLVTDHVRSYYYTLHTQSDQTSAQGFLALIMKDDDGHIAEYISRPDLISLCFATGDEYDSLTVASGEYDSALWNLLPAQGSGAPDYPAAPEDTESSSGTTAGSGSADSGNPP